MEPLGTITKDFPYLDDFSRTEMETAMREASDYWDFSNNLGARVCDNQSPPNLLFYTLLHARSLVNVRLINRIKKAYPQDSIAKPFYFHFEESYVKLAPAIEGAINSTSNPAILFYLYDRQYRSTEQGTIEEAKAQKKIESLLEQFNLSDAFKAYYSQRFGNRLRAEGHPERAGEYYQSALELSRKADDRWHQVNILCLMAELDAQYSTEFDCFRKARDYLREAREIAESLNDKAGIASILQFITDTSYSRGNFSECIDTELEAIGIMESFGGEIGAYAYNLSNSYSQVGEGKNALEWAKCALVNYGPDPYRQSYAHMVMARAFIELNRVDEAQQYLDTAKELIHHSGLDYAFAQWHQTNGRLERLRGDFDAAMDELQIAYEINERFNRYARLRSCLHILVLTELVLFNPSKETNQSEQSGPWMKKMELMCEKNDIPGYSGFLSLVKSELRVKQGRYSEAIEILDELIEFSNNPSLRHIHNKALEFRERIIMEGTSRPSSK